MISRNWRGVARAEKADAYIQHLQNDTFPKLSLIPGFLSASILRRPATEGVEFLIITTWRSMDAIRQFAGENAETAVVPSEVQAMMLEYDLRVVHYEIVQVYQ
ncbi:MAG TPA: antibiotic biosynthesis monooxygenase [Pyrinomonadaceae bacterium]|jgi:heme-degrading monooxygenase HmoA